MAKEFNREAGTGYLARLNLYLSLALQAHDPKKVVEIQAMLAREVLSTTRLQQLTNVFANRNLHEKWVLLGRAQLLVGIKLLVLYGCEEGGNCLEHVEDLAKIGELMLAINSCYGPGFGEPNLPVDDVIVHLATSAELHNPETLVNGFVRIRVLLGPVLNDYIASLKGQNPPPPFERIFTLLNGLNFRDFLDIMLYMDMECRQMLGGLIEARTMVYADVTQPKRYVSGHIMRAWAELMSVDRRNLKAIVEGSERDSSFFYDLTMFRRFPLWRVDEERYFVIDSMFLAERLSSFGFYWTVVNGLVEETLRESFQRVWGELIQEYVRRLLNESHPAHRATFMRKPVYSDDGSEVFDSAIVVGDGLIPVEIKSSVLPIGQKYTGEASSFYQGLSAKFGSGHGAAVEQLLRNIGQIFSPTKPRQSSIPAADIREIFPIVIVHEPILRFGFAAQALADEFFTGVAKLAVHDGLMIYRLHVMDIETIERLEPYIQAGDFTLVECLRAKAREAPNEMGFWQFMVTSFMPSRGIEPRPNSKLLGRFDWLAKAMSWRVYRGDYYDHSLALRGQPSERAIVCARTAGGDELLRDEVIAFQDCDNVNEAYAVAEEIQKSGFPKHEITTDWIECAVVDEFGFLLGKPLAETEQTEL
jgi:hypothetical protein